MRFAEPVFAGGCETCVLTVFSLSMKVRAISLYLRPTAMSSRTSRSRAVRPVQKGRTFRPLGLRLLDLDARTVSEVPQLFLDGARAERRSEHEPVQ